MAADVAFKDFVIGLDVAVAVVGDEIIPGIQGGEKIGFSPEILAEVIGSTITVKVHLSSAQILSLDSVAIDIVAAPGAGKMIRPLSAVFNLVYNSIQYATSGSIGLRLGSAGVGPSTSIITQNQNSMDFKNPASVTLNGSIDTGNSPLQIIATSSVTTGNSTMDVYVTYIVINL